MRDASRTGVAEPGASSLTGVRELWLRRLPLAILFLAVVLLGAWTTHRLPGTPPLEGDDVYVLGWASQARAADLIRVDPSSYPEWRPLAFATVWLQFQMTGLSSVVPYQIVNIVCWLGCVCLAGWLVYRVTGGWAAPAVSMAVLVTDARWMSSLIWIDDRQTTIACLLGLSALIIALPRDARLSGRSQVLVGALLLCAPLGKEYGLAFALSVAAVGVLDRRRDLLWPAIGALAVYAALRLVLVSGASQRYCEDVGFFFGHRRVCSNSPEWIAQVAYNVVATFLGSLFEGVFDSKGAVHLSVPRLLLSAVVVAMAVGAWVSRDRTARVGLGLLVFNAALSLMLYRTRNQPIALTGVALAAGIGFERLRSLSEGRWTSLAAPSAAVLIALNAALHGVQFHAALDEHRLRLDRQQAASAGIADPGDVAVIATVCCTVLPPDVIPGVQMARSAS